METNYIAKVTEMNSPYFEENGYWYSKHSGNWYQKVYRDSSKKYYGWEKITEQYALESLNNGFLPNDLQAEADYQFDLIRDQQLGL